MSDSTSSGRAHFLNLGSSDFILLTYLPIYFQVEKGSSALGSGVATLPFVSGIVVSGMVSQIKVSCCFSAVL